MAGRRNRRHSTPCLLHASCSGTLISNSDPKLHSYKFFYPMILNPNSPRSCRFFNSLRTRTISETLSNTRPWCCLSSEPRGFRLTNTTISVTFHIYFSPKCSSKLWFNSIWWSNCWFGRLTFHGWFHRYASLRWIEEAGDVLQGREQTWCFDCWSLRTCSACWQHITKIVSCLELPLNDIPSLWGNVVLSQQT